MKRMFAVLSVVSLTLVMTIAAVAQAPSKKAKPEQLSKQQLNTLISTAKTPAEQQRIASFYEANALDYRAQVQEHEAMILAYKSNSSISNDKNRASTIGHCEYFVKSLNNLAAKNDELAKLHKKWRKTQESSKSNLQSPGPVGTFSGPGNGPDQKLSGRS